jgi:hypothetical protein
MTEPITIDDLDDQALLRAAEVRRAIDAVRRLRELRNRRIMKALKVAGAFGLVALGFGIRAWAG